MRELPHHRVQQSFPCFPVLLSERHDGHYLSRGGGADDECAQETVLLADVIERQPVLPGIFADEIAYLVRGLSLKVAMVDVHHLVEQTRHMKAHCRRAFQVRRGADFLACQEAFVRESKLQFVTVVQLLLGADDGAYVAQGHLADAFQIVRNLLLLEFQLLFVS